MWTTIFAPFFGSVAREAQRIRQFMAIFYQIELAVPGAGGNLVTGRAAVCTSNRSEGVGRTKLHDDW